MNSIVKSLPDDGSNDNMSDADQSCDQIDSGDNAFFKRFFFRLPNDVARSFTDDQLKAITVAFGTRRRHHHPIEIRWTLPWFKRGYYIVLLAGTERRSRERRLRDRLLYPTNPIGNGIVAAGFYTAVVISALAMLYIVKSLLGINLSSEYSLGLMPVFEQGWKSLFG